MTKINESEEGVWNVGNDLFIHLPNGKDIQVHDNGEITASVVATVAGEAGLSNFVVRDLETGNKLSINDFPVKYSVSVEEYNTSS